MNVSDFSAYDIDLINIPVLGEKGKISWLPPIGNITANTLGTKQLESVASASATSSSSIEGMLFVTFDMLVLKV